MKKKVVLLFGGRSSEHEISCVTATGILGALDRDLYDPLMVGITKEGGFVHVNEDDVNFKLDPHNMPVVQDNGTRVFWPESAVSREMRVADVSGKISSLGQVDVVFPVLHGPFGEDGTIQGMLELLNIPYVGSGVLSSAMCMDKHIAKTILQSVGIDVAPWRSITLTEYKNLKDYSHLDEGLTYPIFVKPSRAGSSVGVSRVTEKAELKEAIEIAFKEDHTALIESGVIGREVEIAVLQGRPGMPPRASTVIGEIVFQGKDFYDYEAKYLGSEGVRLELPAKVSASELQLLSEQAIKAYKVLQCSGPARIDFFLTADGVILNELNTMPGFTPISMYPQLWHHSGLEYKELVTELIELATETVR
ncbi:MAG TPA: D-alanine--D-alanine ligase family protein [Microbacteriaceae bacterium]|nr:D-alanine--D-alanine ligase family protein [Microbacteriaceae bacterium]